MRMFKKMMAALLVVAMLASMAVVVSAEETAVIETDILNSITVEEGTGRGLAFRITMNIQGAQKNAYNEFINTNATAAVDGEVYSVVKMGAVMANQAADIANMNNLTLADVTGLYVLDIPAKYLCAEPTADACEFAVRITNLPEKAMGRAIGCRPYVVLKDAEGNESTVYGDVDIATYHSVYYTNNAEETPVLNLDLANVDDKIAVSATAEYAAYDPATYVEAFKVNATLSNVSANAKTSVGDTIVYAFKDAEGNVLDTATVAVDELTVGKTKDVEFYAPIGTATIVASELNLNYVPDITLPAIGSDIDVTKKKNRIRVSAASASFNEDGTIHVSLTFKNYTSNWITEETDYVKYTYYKDNTGKGTKTLYIGVIDTKKNPVKTFEFDVPSYTTKVSITSSKIVYWTEWA